MTTLAANLSSSATTMRVNAADDDPAPYYQIDDEIVQLQANSTTVNDPFYSPYRTRDETLWQIERAVSGTTATSHLSGATLTPVYDPSTGGGEQTVRLLGPYAVSHETPAIDSGAIVATLPDGVAVVRVSIIPLATWNDTAELGVFITDAALEDWTDALCYLTETTPSATNTAWLQEGYNVAMGQQPGIFADKSEPPLVLTKVDAKLVFISTGAPTAGSAQIYVFIAEPA